MGRWIVEMFTARRIDATNLDEGCSVCDHPFGHLTHACISSIGPVAPMCVELPIRLPEAVVA
ncbi:hypothetical protein CIW49_13915 [Mycolicibacterium sp. P1-18]|uniref:hypothetical protein n=1 Tax=Mycolicibacterium sp. P1-18 TaxID=2024615 RepID=UPI0011F3BD37|nr:hypothetical protein [Mycolicibacterium sp. P1-18]KAA0098960.1 hypothetical protein CIW49_13915 [Mycolicibacterium sp. P1-18]